MADIATLTPKRPPAVFRVREAADLDRIPFQDGVAAVEVPAELLAQLRLKNDLREDSDRLRAVEASIRSRGYVPVEPITARIGRKGKWVIINGGHRLTAVRHIMRDWWLNLFGQKVKTLYFILFTDDLSWSKAKQKPLSGQSEVPEVKQAPPPPAE